MIVDLLRDEPERGAVDADPKDKQGEPKDLSSALEDGRELEGRRLLGSA
jgi:hypothetical protein